MRKPIGSITFPEGIIHIPVLNPLENVAMHIIETQRVERKTSHTNSLFHIFSIRATKYRIIPFIVCLIRRKAISCLKGCSRPGPCRILPLRFCGKPIFFCTVHLFEFMNEFLDVVPGNLLHQAVVAATPEMGRVQIGDLVGFPLDGEGHIHRGLRLVPDKFLG